MAVSLLAEFKSWCKIDSSDTTSDTALGFHLARAQADVEGVLGFKLDTATVVSELQDSYKVVFPSHLPITTLTSVKYRENPLDALQDITLVEGVDYVQRRGFEGLTRYIELLNYVTALPQRIVLNYVGGYTSAYPGAIVSAILLLAARERSMSELQSPEAIPGDNRVVAAAKAKLIPFVRGTV